MNTMTSPRPNYTARRFFVSTIVALFIYFVGIPLWIAAVRLACEVFLWSHSVLTHFGFPVAEIL